MSSPSVRIAGIDAYRGFVMLLMLAEVLHFDQMAEHFPSSRLWAFLHEQQSHVAWRGCTLHDLIQPSFSFLVGVALPYSLAGRMARGQGFTRMTLHAVGRAVSLVLLGVFLRSVGQKQTNWTFEDTLSQIGLGYVPLFVIACARPKWQWAALVVVVCGYWGLFAGYPLPPADFDYPSVGVPADWEHQPTGFAAHWAKNSNPAWAFDTWFLNSFPRKTPFTHNGGGYATLSFLPTLGTMILGLIAGRWLKDGPIGWQLLGRFVGVGGVLLAIGFACDKLGICPNVKRIWTPAWVLFSGGWCFLLAAIFIAATDVSGYPGWSYFLRVIGANSIVAYVGSHLIEGFVLESFKTHLGPEVFQRFGPSYEPLVAGGVVLVVYWLILLGMYRNRFFVRI